MSPVLNPSPNPKPLPPEQAPASEASPPNGAEGEASPSQSPPEVVDSPRSPEMQKLWTKFCAHYPEGVLDLDKAEAAFRKLPLSEASDCVHGVELYADRCKRVRQQKPMRAHLFIRKRTWAGLLATKPTTGKILAFSLIPIASQAGFALANLYRMTHPGDPVDCHDQHGNKCYSVPAPVTPQVVALADVPRHSRWEFYELHMPNCAAWRRFVEGYTGKRLAVTTRPGSARPGIYAPHPWPPRIDGTWSESPESPPSTGPPSVPKIPELTEDDIDVLTDALG